MIKNEKDVIASGMLILSHDRSCIKLLFAEFLV